MKRSTTICLISIIVLLLLTLLGMISAADTEKGLDYSDPSSAVKIDISASELVSLLTKDEIESIQSKLLDQAYEMLKSGGEMVYSTCSINKKENDSQIMTFLSRHKDMKRVFEKQIFPNEYDSDGFYICKLVKE